MSTPSEPKFDTTKPIFELHTEAQKSFNKQADDLVALIAPQILIAHSMPEQQPFTPDLKPVRQFPQDDISEYEEGFSDASGVVTSRYFSSDGQKVGLPDRHYGKFVQLCEKLQRTSTFRRSVSLDTVQSITFKWLNAKYENSTTEPLTQFFCD